MGKIVGDLASVISEPRSTTLFETVHRLLNMSII